MAGSMTRTKPDLVVGCRSLAMVRSADSASSIMGTANKKQQQPTQVNTKQQRDTCFYHNFMPKPTFVNTRQQKPTLPRVHFSLANRPRTLLFMRLGSDTYTIIVATNEPQTNLWRRWAMAQRNLRIEDDLKRQIETVRRARGYRSSS